MKTLLLILATTIALTASAQSPMLGTWTGKLDLGMAKLTLAINLSNDAAGNVQCTLDSPDQGAKGIPANVNACTDDSLSVSVPQIGMTYTGRLAGNVLKGNFTQMGRTFPLDFTKGEEKVNRPQTPVAPFPYKSEEITFTDHADAAMLTGTVTYPVGYEKMKPADVPVVLMVTGSGLQNRDEELLEHKPFLVIADYLARNGIASLRYDDRGTGDSKGGDNTQATTLNYANDAQAGLNFLKCMNKFGKFGVLGHSEGGNIAFILGARDKADFIVSLAAVGVKGDTALTAQANRVMQLNGMPGTARTADYRNMVLMQNKPWLTFFVNYDPAQDIAQTRCPVLALNGDKDCQVISSLNLEGIKAALQPNEFNRCIEYPGLNHLFQECTTGNATEYRSIEQTISPQVLKDIVEWIKKLK